MSQLQIDNTSQSRHPYFQSVLATTDEAYSLIRTNTVIVQADVDPLAYEFGHIPGARHWDWTSDLRNSSTGDIISERQFAALMARTGIRFDTPVILYGDNNNWFACWAYWVMKTYGHENVRILDGGIKKCVAEGKLLVADPSLHQAEEYIVQSVDYTIQAKSTEVLSAIFDKNTKLIDVRSKAEFRGDLKGPGDGMAETCGLGGHIPTAINIPWDANCNSDGTFRVLPELKALYEGAGIVKENKVIAYCAIGERASLTWFVLTELLGYEWAMNYDRSMAYWTKLPNAPIIRGDSG